MSIKITCIALSALYHWHIDKTWDWYNVSYGSKQNSPVDEEIVAEKAEIGCRSYVVTDNTYVLVLPWVGSCMLPAIHYSCLRPMVRIAKCSILAFYRRISPSKKHRYMLYGFGFALIFQAILNVLVREIKSSMLWQNSDIDDSWELLHLIPLPHGGMYVLYNSDFPTTKRAYVCCSVLHIQKLKFDMITQAFLWSIRVSKP